MSEEETIAPEIVDRLYENGKYFTQNTKRPTWLQEIVHSMVGNVATKYSWAKIPQMLEMDASLDELLENRTAEELDKRGKEMNAIEASLQEAHIRRVAPNKQKVKNMLVEVFQYNFGDSDYSTHARKHLEEAFEALELGTKEELRALAGDKKARERVDDQLKKTGERGYRDMDRDSGSKELG